MQQHAHDPMKITTTARGERIAAIHGEHARALERRVARRASAAAPQTIEDACSFAWMQLLTHPDVDLDWRDGVLGWLEQTAKHEAWRLEARRGRDGLGGDVVLERWLSVQAVAGADELAARRARLELVTQLPERPRRFLLRLALGHSFREIAEAEGVSLTTTDKQIARAKRQLRRLDAEQAAA